MIILFRERRVFTSKIDKNFILETFSHEHKELLLEYQILVTAIFTASIGFEIAYEIAIYFLN